MSLMLKVVYDDFTKTMKFNNTDTVAEVMEKISDAVMKTVGTRPAPQGAHSIFYMSASVLCSSSSDDVAISTLPLKNMDTIYFKKRLTSSATLRRPPSKPLPGAPGAVPAPVRGERKPLPPLPPATTTTTTNGGGQTPRDEEQERKAKEEKERERVLEEAENGQKGTNSEGIDRGLAKSQPEEIPTVTKERTATFLPGPTGKAGPEMMFVVECKELQFKKTMKVASASSLDDLVDVLVKRGLLKDPENYGFFAMRQDPRHPVAKTVKLDRVIPIAELGIASNAILILEKVQIAINVELPTGTMLALVEHPETSVREVMHRVLEILQKKEVVEKPEQFRLFLPNKGGNAGGIVLHPTRKVSSYRLGKTDILQFKRKCDLPEAAKRRTTRLDTLLQSSENHDELYLTLECPSKGVKSTFQFKNSTTVGEMITTFTKKTQAGNPADFALYHTNDQGEEVPLESLHHIGHYKLKNLSKLILKEVSTPRVGTYVKPRDPDEHLFGVDPTTLEQVEDRGFKVPAHLVKLKNVIYEQNGIEATGVFRLAGDELEMQIVKKSLNVGAFNKCDFNSAATLIKRWFGELPVRIFAALPTETFNACVNNIDQCKTMPDKLPEPQRSLFLWLAELLLDVARKEGVNKMGPGNLGVVVAPVLAHIPDGNPIASLIVTGQAVGIMEKYLIARLADEAKEKHV